MTTREALFLHLVRSSKFRYDDKTRVTILVLVLTLSVACKRAYNGCTDEKRGYIFTFNL